MDDSKLILESLDDMEQRFDSLEKRLDKIDGSLKDISKKIDAIFEHVPVSEQNNETVRKIKTSQKPVVTKRPHHPA
ncbi:MAG: hypothetical protein IPM92_16855 [Saprospiraceae bacterium]|nr:hypothetical protein [Saprospiraceae bacterium]